LKNDISLLPDETFDVIEDIRIIQKKKGHRFTTDSILLARHSSPKRYTKVLELGTGCGVVSMLLARMDPAIRITAVEIQKEASEMAIRNVRLNNMESRITILNRDIKDLPGILPSSNFDYIITNPPYRSPDAGRTSPVRERAIAGQEFAVTIGDIMKVSQYLLKIKGRLSLVYAAERLVDLFSEMRNYRIEPKKLIFIPTRKDGEVRPVWVEGVREGKPGIKIFVSDLT